MTLKMTMMTQVAAAVSLTIAATAPAFSQGDEDWLKAAELGSFAPASQDWDAIEAAAREEGQVVLYSVSSRAFGLADAFKERFGVEMVVHDISSTVQLEKLRREHKAGIFEVDVLYNNESATMASEFVPMELVWNFVPDSATEFLEEEEMAPFLAQRWSSRVLVYNTNAHPDGAPIDNLWDLTREEWKSRFQIPDPLESSVQANVIQTILQHSDEMAAAYQAEFGEEITYSEDVIEAVSEIPTIDGPNASIEWLYRLMQNDPVFVGSTNRLFENVASLGQDSPPLVMLPFSKLRDVEAGTFEASAAFDVQPTFGVAYPTVLAIADNAPHPNAAKLLIRYMIEEGLEPWNVLGDYAARSDIESEQVKEYEIPAFEESGLWTVDPEFVYDTKYSFLQLYLSLQ